MNVKFCPPSAQVQLLKCIVQGVTATNEQWNQTHMQGSGAVSIQAAPVEALAVSLF